MALTDDELFDFDKQELMGWDEERVERAFAEQRDVFRAQLVVARHLERWAGRVADDTGPGQHLSEDYLKAFTNALLEVAAHLRQGDYLPGGSLHDETDSGEY